MQGTLSFSDTAAYFELKARRETGMSRRADFEDTARFYRELGDIIPFFPAGWVGRWDATASRLDSRAEECRSLAAVTRDLECRDKFLRLAVTYASAAEIAKAAPRLSPTRAQMHPSLRRSKIPTSHDKGDGETQQELLNNCLRLWNVWNHWWGANAARSLRL